MSLFHFIFDDIWTSELSTVSMDWIHLLDAIANWASDEEYAASKQISISDPNFYITDEYGDYLIMQWGKNLNDLASSAHSTHPEIAHANYLYSAYCLFLSKLLDRYGALIKHYTSRKYQRRYNLEKHEFDVLQKHLLNMPFNLQISKVNPDLWYNIESQLTQLADRWQQMILTAAVKGLPTNPPQ